jgi:hypothetical protein
LHVFVVPAVLLRALAPSSAPPPPQPDVLCLQEVDHWEEVQAALAQLG